jgi:LmbE family N-acetylglucosaminyl deacetylase
VAKWAAADYNVVMVSMTNGDIGHHEMAGGPLARRRVEEAHLAAQRAGVESVVFDNHDGELQPTLAVRKEVVALIRAREADLVITHRPNDYHPDHRYTSQVVQDAAYMVTVPFFTPDVPALRKNPVFMYFMDRFQKPIPFRADVAVAVDDVMEQKWRMLDAMESQMYEWLPWHAGRLDEAPADPKARVEFLKAFWSPLFETATAMGRDALGRCYGTDTAAATRFAELFELSEYGHRPSGTELRRLFPFVPGLGEGA